jgi:hypothetical protein
LPVVIFSWITLDISFVMISLVPLARPPDIFLSNIILGHPTTLLAGEVVFLIGWDCSRIRLGTVVYVEFHLLLLVTLHRHWGRYAS